MLPADAEGRRRLIREAVENELRLGTKHFAKDGKTPFTTADEIVAAIYRDGEIIIDTTDREKPLLGRHPREKRRVLRWNVG